MNLLLGPADLAARAEIARGPLGTLSASLAADLDRVLAAPLFVPPEKARLSRAGGRCPADGTQLEFDPWSPRAHRCARCGQVYAGDEHYRFWIYWYQLWLAERAVHGAALAALGVGDRYGDFGVSVLDALVDAYPRYPNRDNVLGPTRVFFSTYLESIWLLQVTIALDLLEAARGSAVRSLGQRVRDQIVGPSRSIIASYDEGMSNRQVWNNAALIAASRSLGDAGGVGRAVDGPSGVRAHLEHGLLADGTWYEGENYHLFAHRGLWYSIVMLERIGVEVPRTARFDDAFATPFLTALPDFTLPSRRDSPYRVSLRQWRFAELCELGLARRDTPVLSSALAALYATDIPRGDTGRARSSAEAERNSPPSALDRSDLGWRSLLFASPDAVITDAEPLPSVTLEEQGIAVMRRDRGRVYVALDYGHSGGGHGHPDRLNLLFANGPARWLDDVGTGSYVDPSLHWYRSTLAHNAPLADGRSQWRVEGFLHARSLAASGDEWVSAQAAIAPGVWARRSAVLTDVGLVDEVRWRSSGTVCLDLPLHAVVSIGAEALRFEPARLPGSDGVDDGFRFVDSAERARLEPGPAYRLRASDGATYSSVDLWVIVDQATELWRCRGPGPPGDAPRTFVVLRATCAAGRYRVVWNWSGRVRDVGAGERLTLTLDEGATEAHESTVGYGWVVRRSGGQTISLTGFRSPDAMAPGEGVDQEALAPAGEVTVASPVTRVPSLELARGAICDVVLGEADYRASEDSWDGAGRPAATVSLHWDGEGLDLALEVTNVDRSFVPAGAVNEMDNEPADVNGTGVQLYVAQEGGVLGAMLVPADESGTVRVRPIDGWSAASADSPPRIARVSSRMTPTGFDLTIRLIGLSSDIALDVVINEKPAGRERRRGQLVFSGVAPGERVYLRGDRHDPDCLIPIHLAHV